MSETYGETYNPETDVQVAHDNLLKIGEFTVAFARVDRVPRYPDGERESDVEHSFHLGLSAIEIAKQYYPELDVGLVAQFSLVHDFPERYTGDVPTFDISDVDRQAKEDAEHIATERLITELPPYLANLLERYERQQEPEARFVRFIDKLLPAIINAVASEATTFKTDYGVQSIEQLNASRAARTAKFQAMFPEFQFIHLVRDMLSVTSAQRVFNTGA